MKERIILTSILISFLISAVVSIYFFPSFSPIYKGEQILSLGGLSSVLENIFGEFFPYFVKIVASVVLIFFVRKNFAFAIPSFVLIFITAQNSESLLFTLVLIISSAPFWAVIIFSLLIPFISKLALPVIILSVILRIILKKNKRESYAPLFGFISPPFVISIIQGNLFLPFLLSFCSLKPFMPISTFSPFFWFFSVCLLILLIYGEQRILKVFLAILSYLFNPLFSFLFIPIVAAKTTFKKSFLFLFVIPLILSIAYPQNAPYLPDGVKKVSSSVESKNFSVAVSPEIYFEARNFFREKGATIKPELKFSNLLDFYKSLPMMPPLTGYTPPKGDLILVKANYPQNQNLRLYNKGYALVWCGESYSLFASESFFNKNPKLKKLNYYSPYVVLPQEIEQRKLALAEIDEILKDEPNFFEGLRDRGRIYLDLQEPQKAVESFESALKIKKSAQVYNDLGVAYTNLERYDDAMNAYLESMKISPRDIYPRMNYAYAAMTAGKFEDALVVLEDLNRAYPTFYPAFRLHYQVYGRMGEVEKAKEILRKMPKEILTRDEKDLLGEK